MSTGLAMAYGKRVQPPPEHSNPTQERLSKGDYELGSDKNRVIVTMRDSPFENAHTRGKITDAQYNAGRKYLHHWYHSGMADPLHSVDLNRIFANDVSGFSGMAKTEAQAFHRQQYRLAAHHLGQIASGVVESIVCREETFEQVGYKLGAESKTRAIELSAKQLGRALFKLHQLWA